MRTLLAILFTINSFIAFAEAQEYGLASVYSATFQGKRTASGEIFNHNDLTAAHQKFPFGSLVRVTRLDNGKSVVVRIIDRGPFVSQRVTDLSKAAAVRLGVTNEKEEIRVKLELLPNRGSEMSQTKERNPTKDSQNSNEQPYSTPSSEKVEVNTKSVEQPAVLKEYKHVQSKGYTPPVQKKSLK
jgi:rare lipoprotein A